MCELVHNAAMIVTDDDDDSTGDVIRDCCVQVAMDDNHLIILIHSNDNKYNHCGSTKMFYSPSQG